MIIKDESELLDNFLKRVKPYVDEIIIVDTGSSDNVVSFEQKKEIDRINKLLPTSEDQIKKSNDS